MTSRRLSFTFPEKHYFEQLAPTTSEAVDCLLAWRSETKIGPEQLLTSIEDLKRHAPEGHPTGAPKYKPSQAACELLAQMQALNPGLSLNMMIRGLVRLRMGAKNSDETTSEKNVADKIEGASSPPPEAVTTHKFSPVSDLALLKGRHQFLIVFIISIIVNFPLLVLVVMASKEAETVRAEFINAHRMKDAEIEKLKMQLVMVEAKFADEEEQRKIADRERDVLKSQLKEKSQLANKATDNLRYHVFSQVVMERWDTLPVGTRQAINKEYTRLYDLATAKTRAPDEVGPKEILR